jgi:hypothetical protein
MRWEAFYEPWDAITDRRTLTALCLVFDRVHVWTLDHSRMYPSTPEAVREFENRNYEKVRMNDPDSRRRLEEWNEALCVVYGASGLRWSLDQTIELDRSQLLAYALDWYPFFNYITPLAEGDDPVLVPVESTGEPDGGLLGHRDFLAGVFRPRTMSDMARLLRQNRMLGIQREMRAASRSHGGVCVSDRTYATVQAIDKQPFWELFAPLLAQRLVSQRIPCNAPLEAEEILEARDTLRGELGEFRSAMTQMALDMVACIDEDGTVGQRRLGLLIEAQATKVDLALDELKNRIRKEDSRLTRKMMDGAGGPLGLSSLLVSFLTSQWWVSAVGMAVQSGWVYRDHKRLINEMKRETGCSFLLRVEQLEAGPGQ